MKRDARRRAGRIALKAEAKKGRTCYTKLTFSFWRFRAAGKKRPRGPNAIFPQNLAFTGVNSPTHFEAPSPASTLRSNGAACLIEVFKGKRARAARAQRAQRASLSRVVAHRP